MAKPNGKIQKFMEDEACLEAILSASDEQILCMADTEYADPNAETEKLKARLMLLVETYTEEQGLNGTECILNEATEMVIASLEKVHAAQSESIQRMFDGISLAARHMESQMLTIASGFSEQLEKVHAGLYSQVTNIMRATLVNNTSMVTGPLLDHMQTLPQYFSEAQSQVMTVNRSIENMQQQADRLRVSLRLQGEDLMVSLQQILEELSATSEAMSQTVDDDAPQGWTARESKKVRYG